MANVIARKDIPETTASWIVPKAFTAKDATIDATAPIPSIATPKTVNVIALQDGLEKLAKRHVQRDSMGRIALNNATVKTEPFAIH